MEVNHTLSNSTENDKEVIQKVLSWDTSDSDFEVGNYPMKNAILHSKLTDSARLLAVLETWERFSDHSFIDEDTVILLAKLCIKVCKSQCWKFLIYNIRKVLVCLTTKFISKDLIVMYKSCILREFELQTCWETKLIYLEITSDIVQASKGNNLNDWLEILYSHWSVICSNVFKVLCDTWEVSDGTADRAANVRSESDNDTCDVQCKNIFMVGYKLTMLWTDIIKKCFSNFGILRSKLLSFILPISSVIQYLDKRCTERSSYKLMLFKSLMKLLNAAFDYGQNLCIARNLDDAFICLAQDVLIWLKKASLDSLPYGEEKGFGGEMTIFPKSENEKESKGKESRPDNCEGGQRNEVRGLEVTPSMTQLRSLSLLIFKTAATLVRFDSEDCQLSTVLNVMRKLDVFISKFYSSDFNWIHEVFLDQDDSWIEALLALLDTYLYFQKRHTMVVDTDKVLSICPHRQFVWFLHCTGFDHSIVVDLLISPETCFLLYLTKYLKVITVEWLSFVETHSTMEKQLKESTQDVSTNNCTLPSRTDTGVKRSNCETGHFYFDVKMPRTENIPMDESGSGIFYDENKGCINNTSADVKSANKAVSLALFDDNGSTEVQDTLALFDDKGSTEVQDTFGSSNSKTIAEYIESDTNSSSAENIGFCINSEFDSSSRMTNATVSKYNVSGLSLLASYTDDEDSEEDDDESDYRDGSSDDSSIRDDYLHQTDDSVMFHHPCKVDSLLDKTMAVLIRTRLKLEEFALTGELTYNCKPLVDLIEGCEHLYEHD